MVGTSRYERGSRHRDVLEVDIAFHPRTHLEHQASQHVDPGNRVAHVAPDLREERLFRPAPAAELFTFTPLNSGRVDVHGAGVAVRSTSAGAAGETQPAAGSQREVRVKAGPGIPKILTNQHD